MCAAPCAASHHGRGYAASCVDRADQPVFNIETHRAGTLRPSGRLYRIFARLVPCSRRLGWVLSDVGVLRRIGVSVHPRTKEIGVRVRSSEPAGWPGLFLRRPAADSRWPLRRIPRRWHPGAGSRTQLVGDRPSDPITMVGITIGWRRSRELVCRNGAKRGKGSTLSLSGRLTGRRNSRSSLQRVVVFFVFEGGFDSRLLRD